MICDSYHFRGLLAVKASASWNIRRRKTHVCNDTRSFSADTAVLSHRSECRGDTHSRRRLSLCEPIYEMLHLSSSLLNPVSFIASRWAKAFSCWAHVNLYSLPCLSHGAVKLLELLSLRLISSLIGDAFSTHMNTINFSLYKTILRYSMQI